MKNYLLVSVIFALVSQTIFSQTQPDITTNRYATTADAAYWPTVNESDYIFFKGNTDGGDDIYAPGGAAQFLSISLPVGKKILIYAGDYERIYINGANCASTPEQPTIITNLGGQVRWGYSTDTNQYRNLELYNFKHLHLSGKYDSAKQTGDPNFLGHDDGNAMGSGDYYEKYGLWGNPRWSGIIYHHTYGNGVALRGFDTVKVDYVASWGGYFSSFNVKTDNPSDPSEVEIDIQDCFAGFTEGEAFYISFSTKAFNQDISKLTLKNNITAFTGAEALQTDNLSEGSIIENNVCLGAATFYRHPFQALYQDNLHQFSFVEGNITVRNNILIGANGALHQFRYKDANSGTVTERTDPSPDKPVTMENNFYGFGRTTMGYMWPGDGITPYVIKNNVYGAISVSASDDSVSTPADEDSGFFNIGNNNNDITLDGNIYPPGKDLYFLNTADTNNITRTNNTQNVAPTIQFKNSGFPNHTDWRKISFWSATYDNTPTSNGVNKDGQFIPYKLDDIVIYYDATAGTKFFKCIQAHAGNFDPNSSPNYWEHMTWNGRNLPPLDVRIQKDTYYNYRGMGLVYNEANETSIDLTAPIINLVGGEANFKKGSQYFEPGFTATDNKDGDLTSQVVTEWVGAAYNPEQVGNYIRSYNVIDAAGNIALTVFRKVQVSDLSVNEVKTFKINMHQFRPSNMNGWTDLANNDAGLLNPKGATTITNLFDTTGQATGYVLSIDNTEGSSSEHYKTYDNGTGRSIGDFPAEITTEGIRIRDPHENPCQFVFSNLHSNHYYDVYFTGYKAGSGNRLESTLSHEASDQSSTINIQDNQAEIGALTNLAPDSNGRLTLDFSTATSGGQPNISALIIKEKTGVGVVGSAPQVSHPAGIVATTGLSTAPIQLTLTDTDTNISELSISAFSSNSEILPTDSIHITGSGASRQLSLTPQQAGNVNLTLLVGDGLTYVPIQIQVKVLNPEYQAWIASYFPTEVLDPELDESVWGALADPDQDSISNILERFWGTNPNLTSPKPTEEFIQQPTSTSIRIQISKDLAGLTWTPLWSLDLKSWQDSGLIISNPQELGNLHTYEINIPETLISEQGFFKIEVSENAVSP